MRVLFLACVAVAGVAGFLVTSSSWPAGAKLAAVLGSAAVAGIVLLTMAKLVLCDPT